jgi:hypothetical protein
MVMIKKKLRNRSRTFKEIDRLKCGYNLSMFIVTASMTDQCDHFTRNEHNDI